MLNIVGSCNIEESEFTGEKISSSRIHETIMHILEYKQVRQSLMSDTLTMADVQVLQGITNILQCRE